MKTVKFSIDPNNPATLPKGRVDIERLDATTEQDIAAHQQIDDAIALFDAAKFACRY